MGRIALLTSGGDAPGMNPCIRAVANAATLMGAEVVGVRRGFRGLHEKDAAPLAPAAVEGIVNQGGTFLRSSRFLEMKDGAAVARCAENLKALGADALIVVGGEGSVQGSLALSKAVARVIHVPSTIDNDVKGTDVSLGVDTCLNTILRLVDSIRDTASSMERPIVFEVMGRLTGYLAIMAAVGSGARAAILPERPFPWDRLRESVARGGQYPIIVCAEGAGSAKQVVDQLKDMFPGSVPRVSVLGYIQRGGTPSFFDRLLGARLGESAVEAVLGNVSGKMIAWRSGNCVPIPLEDVAGHRRQVSPEVFEIAKQMGILFE